MQRRLWPGTSALQGVSPWSISHPCTLMCTAGYTVVLGQAAGGASCWLTNCFPLVSRALPHRPVATGLQHTVYP